ncbi:MAG: BspA family leucine-rich repeat surface protein, partial [Clostridium sp.]
QEDIKQEVITQEDIEQEDIKQEVITQEDIEQEDIKQEVITQEDIEQEDIKQEVVTQVIDKKSNVNNFDLNEWEKKEYSSVIILDKYKGTDTDIVIPGEVNGKQVKLGTMACFENIKSTMTSLTFKEHNGKKVETPTTFKDAFRDYKALESIDLSGLDTSQVNNMSYMFRDCSNLTNIKFGDTFNTYNTTTMNSMFEGCSSLKSLDLSSFNTEQVTNMSYMFRGCGNLTSVNFGDKFSTSKVLDMNSMFRGCSSLTGLDLSGYNTEQVSNMSYMFDGCSSLTSLDLSSFNTTKVANMRYVFNGCNALTSLDLSNFNTEQIDNMDNMFRGCSSLTSLDLSSFNTLQVNSMINLFAECSSLSSINFGDNFNTSQVTTMNNMFKDCTSLKDLDLSNFDTSRVINMSFMFSDSGIESLDLSSFDVSNVTNMQGMFRNTKNLKDINFGNKFITSSAENMSFMFFNSNIDNLDLSSFDTSQATNMKAMFAGMNNINVLDLSNFNLDNVTEKNMQYMFANNIRLDANGTIIEDNLSAVAKELLVVSKDAKLMNYDYVADFCLPLGIKLDANGGEFANGDKVYSAFETNVIESLDEAAINKIINDALAAAPKPIRDGYEFISWETNQTITRDKTSALDKLNAVYYAKWSKNAESSGGSSSDGSITPPESGDTNQGSNNVNQDSGNANQESSNGTDSAVKQNGDNESPKTGDAGVLGYIGLGLTSVLGLFINNRKKNK